MQRNSFVFRSEWMDAIQPLSPEFRSAVYEAIILYGITNKIPQNLNPISSSVFNLIKTKIDYDSDISAKRSEAGKKGGAPKGNTNAKKQAKQAKNNQKTSKKQAKTSNILEDIPPITPIEDNIDSSLRSESAHVNNAREEFEKWLSKNCPYISKHYKLLSDKELEKLKSQYGSKAIANECMNIENRVDLRKKYSNLYCTLNNWLKRNSNGTTKTNQGACQDSENPSDSELHEQSVRTLHRRKSEREARKGTIWNGCEFSDES